MFVVMAPDAGEAEILGVTSAILGEGLTPYDHVTRGQTVIAVIGDIGPRRPALIERLGGLAKVERVSPINRPFKLASLEFHPEPTVIRVLDAVVGDGSLTVEIVPDVDHRFGLVGDFLMIPKRPDFVAGYLEGMAKWMAAVEGMPLI